MNPEFTVILTSVHSELPEWITGIADPQLLERPLIERVPRSIGEHRAIELGGNHLEVWWHRHVHVGLGASTCIVVRPEQVRQPMEIITV